MPEENNSTEVIRELVDWEDCSAGSEVAGLCLIVALKSRLFFDSPRAMAYRLANSLSCKSMISKRAYLTAQARNEKTANSTFRCAFQRPIGG